PHEHVEAIAAPGARDPAAATRRVFDDAPVDPPRAVPPAMAEEAVLADREHVDAVGIAGRGRGLARERSAEGFPFVPARPVPVAVPQRAVVVEREDLRLPATPRRGGCPRAERSAEGSPAHRYLMRPCFFSQAAATSLLSFLSTATCLFMSFSSLCESFALIEFSRRLSVPSSFCRTALRTTGAMLSASCKCLSSARTTGFLAMLVSPVVRRPTTIFCLPCGAAISSGPPSRSGLDLMVGTY